MKKIQFLLLGISLFSFLVSCEPEDISSEASQAESTPTEIYADTGDQGGPIDDKKD